MDDGAQRRWLLGQREKKKRKLKVVAAACVNKSQLRNEKQRRVWAESLGEVWSKISNR